MKAKLGDKSRIGHKRDAIKDLELIIGNKSYNEFMATLTDMFACVKLFEIIGEASAVISEELKNKNPDIGWNEVKGMRSILVHEYYGVSYETGYDTYLNYLPKLKTQLNNITL